MILTLQEVIDTCRDWEEFCRLHEFSEWAVNEGGGDVTVDLTAQQAHHLGIVELPEWKVKSRDDVYPPKRRASPDFGSPAQRERIDSMTDDRQTQNAVSEGTSGSPCSTFNINNSVHLGRLQNYLRCTRYALPEDERGLVDDIQMCVQDLVTEVVESLSNAQISGGTPSAESDSLDVP